MEPEFWEPPCIRANWFAFTWRDRQNELLETSIVVAEFILSQLKAHLFIPRIDESQCHKFSRRCHISCRSILLLVLLLKLSRLLKYIPIISAEWSCSSGKNDSKVISRSFWLGNLNFIPSYYLFCIKDIHKWTSYVTSRRVLWTSLQHLSFEFKFCKIQDTTRIYNVLSSEESEDLRFVLNKIAAIIVHTN